MPSRVPDNTRGSVVINANEAAHYYQVTLSSPGTITLDMNPQIDNLSIMGPQSQLMIAGPNTLQVLLDTGLSAGALTMLPGGTLATGTYTQTGGVLQYLLAPGGAGRITVVNTATLGGTLGVTVTPGLYGLSTPYTLLTASAISGQFAQFMSTPPSAMTVKIAMPGGPRLVAKTDDAIWVALGDHFLPASTTLKRVDPLTNQVTATVQFDNWVSAIVGDGRDLWVGVQRVEPARADRRTHE